MSSRKYLSSFRQKIRRVGDLEGLKNGEWSCEFPLCPLRERKVPVSLYSVGIESFAVFETLTRMSKSWIGAENERLKIVELLEPERIR